MTEAEWLVSDDPMAMLLDLNHRGSGRQYRLFAVACARDEISHGVVPLEQVRDPNIGYEAAILAAEVYADGGELLGRFPWSVSLHLDAMTSDEDIAYSALGYCADVGMWLGPFQEIVPEMIKRYHIHPAHYLRDIFSNFYIDITLSPEWRTSTAVALAAQMYESRDFSAMPILADALMDAGCDNADFLDHCREPGPHVRGCWVVDLVLGKS